MIKKCNQLSVIGYQFFLFVVIGFFSCLPVYAANDLKLNDLDYFEACGSRQGIF